MRTILLLVATLVVSTVLADPAAAGPRRRAMQHLKHIVLDPGHGGENHGTPGAHGIYEKLLTLPIALEIERQLRSRTNAEVTLTRRDDSFVGLRDRTRHANRVGGDLLLSIHLNASPNPEAHGLEVYFLSADSASEEIERLVLREEVSPHATSIPAPGPNSAPPPLSIDQVLQDLQMSRAHEHAEQVAGVMLNELHSATRAPRRGVHQAPFAVLKEAEMPAVVVEVGFLSHATEGKRLLGAAYQRKIATAIVRAIMRLDRDLVRH